MQRASPLCSSNSLPSLPATLPTRQLVRAPFRTRASRTVTASHSVQWPWHRPQSFRLALPTQHSTATLEAYETAKTGSGFIEIGYISNFHGLHGEVRVKASTDFPELRFSKPGRRWLKQQVLGQDCVQEVELLEGRGHPGQKSWILRFRGIDTLDQAKQLIGSTLLVREEDRPELDEGEFYTHDLVGMKVFLKETGQFVGTVANVYNSGASDLLHVKLDSSVNILDKTGKPRTTETAASDHLVWIPFVKAIVPDVNEDRREMQITPPKGLLELNLRYDERSKKERRQLEWKERKKFQRHLIAAKKRLCEMGQKHVFDGLRFGEKAQRSLLADQIAGVNSKLLQQALQNINIPSKRWNANELFKATEAKPTSTLKISEECLTSSASKEKPHANSTYHENGVQLMSKGKLAIVLFLEESENLVKCYDPDLITSENYETSPSSLLQKLPFDDQRFMEIEDHENVPLILVSSTRGIQSSRQLFLDNDYFGFESEKVWFMEEEKLPVVSSSVEEENRRKILMKSPWEILQSPVGSGGIISLLSLHNILDNLSEIGVEYIEVCSTNQRYVGMNSHLLGFVNSRKADLGIQIPKDAEDFEGSFDMIFSMNLMSKLTRRIDKLQFFTTPKPNSHVQMVDKEWVDIIPSSPNSYELCSSIYSSLNACSFDKVCVMQITE